MVLVEVVVTQVVNLVKVVMAHATHKQQLLAINVGVVILKQLCVVFQHVKQVAIKVVLQIMQHIIIDGIVMILV
jgi:hypothetical protein